MIHKSNYLIWLFGFIALFSFYFQIFLVFRSTDYTKNEKYTPPMIGVPVPSLHALIHVGPHKTGCTSLQQYIVFNSRVLHQDNYVQPLVPERGSLWKRSSYIAHCFQAEDEKDSWYGCPSTKRESILNYFTSFLSEAVQNKQNVIMSAEDFSRSTINVGELRDYFVPHFKMHVVLHYRRFYDWLPSFYNEAAKMGSLPRLGDKKYQPTFAEWISLDGILEKFKNTYVSSVYDRFTQFSDINVTVVNLHQKKYDDYNMTAFGEFFCNHVDNATNTCAHVTSRKEGKSNKSEKRVAAFVFVSQVNLYHPIKLSKSGPKRYKRHAIEKKYNEMIKAGKDIPLACPLAEIRDKLLKLSIEYEKKLTPAWWHNSVDGLKSLEEDFNIKSLSKFCDVDTEKVVKSKEWYDFLTNLDAE